MMIKKMFAAALLASAVAWPAVGMAQASDIVVTAQKGRVDTAVFGKRPFMRDPRLSPDGTKIAVMMSRDGVDNLVYLDLAKPGSAPTLIAKAEEFREAGDRTMGGWRWVGNRTLIVTLLSRENIFGQRADLRRLAAYDLESGKLTPIAWTEAGGDGGTILHIDDEKETMLIQRGFFKDGSFSVGPEVLDVDVRTGKFKTVQRPNVEVSTWLVDGKGVIRGGLGQDDKGNQRLMYRSDASGTLKTVSNAKDPTFTNSQIVPEVFLDEPDMAYATSNKDNLRRVYKVNMKTMEVVGGPVFQLSRYDVDGIVVNEAENDMLGVAFTTDKERRKWTDPRLAQVQAFFDEDFGEGNAIITSTNDGDTKLVVRVGETSDPGGYYLYDTESGKLQLLGWVHPILQGAKMNPTDTVRYKASDGMEIEAVVTYPRHRKGAKNLPVVVMPHGGPYGIRDEEGFGFFPWHQAVAELGYVVIQPNYRGSGGYGKEFVKEGRKPNGYGNRMQDDLNDAVTWFAGQGLIDPKRACIMGWSYGGYATARGAQRDGNLWKCAIAGAGVYDFPMMKSFDTGTFGSFGANFQATAADLISISSARNTDGKWSPILIVAGLRDARIPIEQSRTLVSRLKGSGKKEGVDFRYVEQPKGTHNLPYEDVHTEWLVETEKWLERFNPAYIASDPDKPVPVVVTVDTK
ncbi:hypothetical protein ASD67_15520 [Sphingopyxis sp. Root1497]|nr:hypothetical protein ASD67_15520 [Sphingopyxis sp. Root1497]